MIRMKFKLSILIVICICSHALAGPLFNEATDFKGCYRENATAREFGHLVHFASNSHDQCFNYCYNKNFRYAALHRGVFCGCKNQYGAYEKLEYEDCNCTCPGNATEKCGCFTTNLVYEVDTKIYSSDLYKGNAIFRGCYEEKTSSRDLTRVFFLNKNMTQNRCFHECLKHGYRYAGLQHTQCWCGDLYGKYQNLSVEACDCPCRGDPSESCGCYLKNLIYEVDGIRNTSLYTSTEKLIGCYKEERQRDLGWGKWFGANMTHDSCFHLCYSHGFRYAALQNRYVCYCGDMYGKYGSLNMTECDCPCRGNPNEQCGCHWTNLIYEVDRRIHNTSLSNGNEIFKGCYQDARNRDLSRHIYLNMNMTHDQCFHDCYRMGYRYAGLQDRKRCWCGDDYGKYGILPIERCQCECRGNPNEYCGCGWTSLIYEVDPKLYLSSLYADSGNVAEFKGCYRDLRSPRDLSHHFWLRQNNTHDRCFHECYRHGYRYAALQEINRCWCGNSYGRHGILDMEKCDCPCRGNPDEQCGCYMASLVYEVDTVVYTTNKYHMTPSLKGCYQDRRPRDFNYGRWLWKNMTHDNCFAMCYDNGYRYSGLQAQLLCWCGDQYGKYGMLPAERCQCECRGNPEEDCGCGWSNLVYEVDSTVSITNLYQGVREYKGCFKDHHRDRDLSFHKWLRKDMTHDRCFHECHSRGYRYAGLQDKYLCWCGDKYGKHPQVNDTECECPCRGNPDEDCGCSLKTMIYDLDINRETDHYNKIADKMGCFQDNWRDRALEFMIELRQNMTHDRCFFECYSRGYRYAGLQNMHYCYCGNEYLKHPQINDTKCECPCRGHAEEDCGCQYTNLIYDVNSPCHEPHVCGVGAICEVVDNTPVCSCKSTASFNSDPHVKCCNDLLQCSCSGDPHCITFDKARHHFMGACKYDLVSTDCYNQTLLEGLVPFNVRQRQTTRGNTRGVSLINYIEVNVYGNQYRLLQGAILTRNGLPMPVPFNDVGEMVDIYMQGANLVLSTDFGLTVAFDGNHRMSLTLCDAYKGTVCGLCGNADGDSYHDNEFVDRNNQPVPFDGGRWSKYFAWGTKWKTPTDEQETDQDGTNCNTIDGSNSPVASPPEEEECPLENEYQTSNDYCGFIKDPSGPFAQCIAAINPTVLTGLIEGCVFDLCVFENDPIKLAQFRCEALSEFNDECILLSQQLDVNWSFNWRGPAQCPMVCAANEVFEIRDGCPKTCVYPEGTHDCGVPIRAEGCYCKDGYVKNTRGECITLNECGCKLNDGSTVLEIGDVFITNDCTALYTCDVPQSFPNVTNFPACSPNGRCTVVNNLPVCICKENYVGDGVNCEEIIPPTTTPVPRMQCQEDFCYGFGDPHYTSIYGASFKIDKNCSYILAADNCEPFVNLPFYSVIVDHVITDSGLTHMKTIRILFEQDEPSGGVEYIIGKDFIVNGVGYELPYTDGPLLVYRENAFIVFDDPKVTVYFDGELMMKVRTCAPFAKHCGLCMLEDNSTYPFTEQLSYDDRECV